MRTSTTKLAALAIGLALVVATVALAADPAVRLANRTFAPERLADPAAALTELAGGHAIVQLDQTPNAEARHALAADGVRLLKSLGGGAYLARVDDRDFAGRALSLPVRWAGAISPADKIEKNLAAGVVYDYSRVDGNVHVLDVGLHKDVSEQAGRDALASAGVVVLEHATLTNSYLVRADLSRIDALSALDETIRIAEAGLPMQMLLDVAKPAVGGDVVNDAPYLVTGDGVKVLVLDGGTLATGANAHPDLQGRVTVAGLPVPDLIGHPHHVSCIVAGDGTASGGQYEGMAPEAQIISSSFLGLSIPAMYNSPGNMESAYRTAIQTHGATASNNSIGSNLAIYGTTHCEKEGDYERTSQLVDEIAGGSLGPISIVWANGNERTADACGETYYTTAPPATAKNPIAVGAVNKNGLSMTPFSSWGPTDDGRLKPDVSAPGCATGATQITSCAGPFQAEDYIAFCGTSMASPMVAGGVALIQEYWRRQVGPQDAWPSTIKALVIHGSLPKEDPGPDYGFGYGVLDMPSTLDLIDNARIIEETLDQGETFTLDLELASETARATLVWTDPAGETFAERVLVNDLDLSFSTLSSTILPWVLDPANPEAAATRGVDSVNPVEQVEYTGIAGEDVQIVVTGTDVPEGPQAFSLILSGLQEQTADDDDDDNDTGDDDDDDDTGDDDDDSGDDDDDDDTGGDDDDDDSGGCGC